MRELRRDPTTGQWVAITTERMFRPAHLALQERPAVDPTNCPFCPGNEGATDPAIVTVEHQGQWVVRVVPNRHPALRPEVTLTRRGRGPYDTVSGVGAHEVIIESRVHDVPLWEQDPRQMVTALRVARERLRDLPRDVRNRYVSWFRNHRPAAGASQSHPHAQVLGLPVLPPLVQQMVERSGEHLARTERELFQDLIDHDRDEADRIVRDVDDVVAICPWAPQVPFETWLVPDVPGASFADAHDRLVEGLARSMRAVLAAMARELDDPPHHVVLFTAPQAPSPGYRWHVRIQPRLFPCGGFEAATGTRIHAVPPEEAAAVLRGG